MEPDVDDQRPKLFGNKLKAKEKTNIIYSQVIELLKAIKNI